MSRYGGGRSGGSSSKVYIGNLGDDASKTELEKVFGHYGHLRNVWVARNPPGFAFVEFEDPRDASDAVKDLDDTTICGMRAKVELSSGERRRGFGGGRGGGRGFGGGGRGPPRDSRCYECGEPGHFARECPNGRSGGRGYGGRGGNNYSSRRRSYSRSRSRSPNQRRGRSLSRSRSR